MTDVFAPSLGTVGPVHIQVPADPAMSRVLRLAVGGVASLAGLTVDEIDDAKLVVSEVFLALVEHGTNAVVEVSLVVSDTAFEVSARTAVEHFDLAHPDLVLCGTVLASVGATHGIESVDGGAHVWASVARTTGG